MWGIVAAVAFVIVTLFGTTASSGSPASIAPFGGPVPVHIAHVGQIEIDLDPGGSTGLRRVACAGGLSIRTCYVAGSPSSSPLR